jgi:hypothetical protein
MKQKKIDFLVVGNYRSGTSWLQKIFKMHSQIFVPDEKELFYFSRYYDRGVKWYHSFFKNSNKNKIKGEICPSYFPNSRAAGLICEYNPNIKIVLIIRNPIDQIKSMRRLHLNRNIKQSDIISLEEIKSRYIKNVLYYTNLKPFWKSFPEENILILSYDELKKNESGFLKKIYNFLEVENENIQVDKNVNKAFKPRFNFVEKLLSNIGEFLRNNNLYILISSFKNIGLLSFIRNLNYSQNENEIDISEEGINYINKIMKYEFTNLHLLTKTDYSDILKLKKTENSIIK